MCGAERGPGAKGFTPHVRQHSKHVSLSLSILDFQKS